MKVSEAIETRRAYKSFDPEHTISQDEFNELFRSTLLAPTAFNIQNWRFVVVRDKNLREEIRKVSWGQAQVTDASLLIILCADLKSWEKEPGRYFEGASQEVLDFILPALDAYYRDKDQTQRDEAMRSCGIAAQTIMLKAKEMGYDSCPMDGFDFDAVAKLINLPENHVISMFVAVGKQAGPPYPRTGKLKPEEVIIEDRF